MMKLNRYAYSPKSGLLQMADRINGANMKDNQHFAAACRAEKAGRNTVNENPQGHPNWHAGWAAED